MVFEFNWASRIFRILSQFPEETEKTKSAFGGYSSLLSAISAGPPSLLASQPPSSHMLCTMCLSLELSAYSFEQASGERLGGEY